MCFDGGDDTQTTTTQTTPDPWVTNEVKSQVDAATKYGNAGYQPYTGPVVADWTPQMNTASNTLDQSVGSWKPALQWSTGAVQQAGDKALGESGFNAPTGTLGQVANQAMGESGYNAPTGTLGQVQNQAMNEAQYQANTGTLGQVGQQALGESGFNANTIGAQGWQDYFNPNMSAIYDQINRQGEAQRNTLDRQALQYGTPMGASRQLAIGRQQEGQDRAIGMAAHDAFNTAMGQNLQTQGQNAQNQIASQGARLNALNSSANASQAMGSLEQQAQTGRLNALGQSAQASQAEGQLGLQSQQARLNALQASGQASGKMGDLAVQSQQGRLNALGMTNQSAANAVNIAGQQQQMQNTDINSLYSMGQQRRNDAQQIIDFNRQQFGEARDFPLKALQARGAALRGGPMPSTTTTTGPAPNTTGQDISLGLTAAGTALKYGPKAIDWLSNIGGP